MIYSIYKIINIVNNKVYIGFTSRCVTQRFNEHKSRARYDKINTFICNTIKKYGEHNFTVEELYASKDYSFCLNIMEQYFIDLYKAKDRRYGYNTTDGGKARKHSLETKRKISASKMGHYVSPETSEKISKHNRKKYLVTYPNGKTFYVGNLKKFSEGLGLDHHGMLKVQNPNEPNKSYKGFKVMKYGIGG